MNTNESKSRPAFFQFVVGLGLAYATAWFWKAGQSGNDLAAFASVPCGLFATLRLLMALGSFLEKRRRKAIEKRSAQTQGLAGEARWANLKDVRAAGMLEKGGLFLGSLNGKDLYFHGDESLLTVAPPGAGKGLSHVVPNLLLSSDRSLVVTDPKAELFAMTARYREKVLGHRVIVLCPWSKKMGEELAMEIPDHGFNPYSAVRPGPDAKDDIELISSLLLPGKAHMSASDEFWNDGGQTILTAAAMYLLDRYGRVDLPMLRKLLMQPPEMLFDTLDSMTMSNAFGGFLRECGGKLLGALKNASEQFEGWLGSAQKALRIYDSTSPLADHVTRGEIDFVSLKDTPTTIYVIMPGDRATTHAAWLNLVISLAMEMVGRDRSNKKVLFLLDEYPNLGYLPNVLRALAQYRGQGLQAYLIAQQFSQIERIYGKEGLREILGMVGVLSVFGIWESETLSLLSKLMGEGTVRQYSQSVTPQGGSASFGYNYSASDTAKPLLRPSEIRTMPSEEQLIFYRNLHPIKAKKVSYLSRKKLRKSADPNPYFRKEND